MQPVAEFWIDVGGTFTDCLVRTPDGQVRRHKRLSSGITKGSVADWSFDARRLHDPLRGDDPAGFWDDCPIQFLDGTGEVVARARVETSRPDGTLQLAETSDPLDDVHTGQPYELVPGQEAPILAIRHLLGLGKNQDIPPIRVRLGTTRGTNALLTRTGARTALVTTQGFRDILRIGYQNRPQLFDLQIRKPDPLFEQAVEIRERLAEDGTILESLEEAQAEAVFRTLRDAGIESLAICLLNAYAHPRHEEQLERIARAAGFDEISCSHRTAPFIKLVSRGDTTVVDAYLNPVLRRYVATLRSSLGDSDLRILTSSGGLVAADHFLGKDSILSGPAGGVVGFSRVAQAAGFDKAIGFDMGGTSTDVSRFDGRYELQFETEKAGVRVVAPMMAIETVAAGGGSVCHFDGVKLAVGPQSASADPGPACYGRGGPLAVTDLNLILGKLLPDRFPFPLDTQAAQHQLDQLARQVHRDSPKQLEPMEIVNGLLQIANANMAAAIRSVSLARGYNPAEYVLVCFGGAAGQHACAVAEQLGMQTILNHPDAGILSAYGIGLADTVRHQAQGVYRPYDVQTLAELEPVFGELEKSTVQEVVADGIAGEQIVSRRAMDLRYQGLDAYLTVEQPDDGDYRAAYEAEHERRYGYRRPNRTVEIVAVRVQAIGRSRQEVPPSKSVEARPAERHGTTSVYFDRWRDTPIFERAQLEPGNRISGPALILESVATTVVDPGWDAEVLSGGELLLTRADRPAPASRSTDVEQTNTLEVTEAASSLPPADPVLLEIFNNRFAAIAEQMGITLRNTSSSVNVKERLDFSCAIFTPAGDLVVNAPHIPVHLGAMSETVRCLLADQPEIQPGDVFVTNDPFRGGSHLPDVTVITPIHLSAGESEPPRLAFFTASRAHHAEIGGIVPGSMPPFSKNLAEEGVLIRQFKVVDRGESKQDEFEELLRSGPYPSRSVTDNLADVAAQIAANQQGARDLLQLVESEGYDTVHAYMQHIQAAAETKMRAALTRFPDGRHTFTDHLDDGTCVQVAITIEGDTAEVDFQGSGPVHPGNFNANRAIVTSALMYCFRCLIDEDIPLNQGVLAPVTLRLPEGFLNPPVAESPERCPAVVGGNVETSQRVVDAILGALQVAAASQGTMNNLTFGDASFGYYETICGGAGATPARHGADAVHTHMTNTRLTDPEVMEQRFPVRVREFSIRTGSGGEGRFRGGDGVVRRLEFLAPLSLSILSQRRGPHPPYGLAGGQPGACGRNTLQRADGPSETLGNLVHLQVEPGDQLTIETPGGGGYG